MMLETFISDLLYRYDLVIIPDFGGIVSRKKSARFDHETYIFSPPHKELSFNKQLRENDGLLANYVSDILNISYNKALELIAKQVQDWQETLKNDKRLKLDQIGVFNLVANDKIIFLSLTTKNYLADAYGLTSFVHKPLKKSQNTDKTVVPVLNKSEQKPSLRPKIHKTLSKRSKQENDYKLWKYAAVFVVGLGLFTTGISWLKSQNHITEPQFQKATFVLKKEFPAIKINPVKTINVVKSSKPIVENKYFIISGAFRNKLNAEKSLKNLKKAGYPASIIGQNKYGLWMVSLESYNSGDLAHKALNKLKKQQPGLWVFTKR